ncbi:MAG: DUF3846 domain-containing protein [Longimicrobiales bacterium]
MRSWFKITITGMVTELPQTWKPTLEELQREVGEMVEHVQLDARAELWSNEEGKLIDLPINTLATEVWCLFFGNTDAICGDVLINLTGSTDRNRAVRALLIMRGVSGDAVSMSRHRSGRIAPMRCPVYHTTSRITPNAGGSCGATSEIGTIMRGLDREIDKLAQKARS